MCLFKRLMDGLSMLDQLSVVINFSRMNANVVSCSLDVKKNCQLLASMSAILNFQICRLTNCLIKVLRLT